MKPMYDMVEINSSSLVVPKMYQRRLNTDRVAAIVAEFDERIANEPKVSLRDGTYFIFDGQHTVMARKQKNGNCDLPILCKVYYGMTEDEEARLFAAQTGKSAPLTPSAKLRANLYGNDANSLAFVEATEKAGLHIGYERAPGKGRIICINTAFAEFKRSGPAVYTEALTVMHKAWEGAPESLRAELIRAMIRFVELYHNDYNRSRLVAKLRETNPVTLYLAGMSDKSLKGRKKYVNLILRIYNGTSKKGALPVKF